jgi:translocation protein SEC63
MKITDIPFSRPNEERNYRSYKMQFQAPQSTGLFTWKAYLISDTFVGEEVTKDVTVSFTLDWSVAFIFNIELHSLR